jgi:HD-GYP domain-containing protein (c-di-GMP phosphodiesterase class II)
MERMVNTQKLKIGMYVSGLDRPWLDTPFLLQGFFIEDDKDIEDLKNYCKYVFIDIDQGIEADAYLGGNPGSTEDNLNDFLEHGDRFVEYEEEKSALEEFPIAELALDKATAEITTIMDDINSGDNLDIQAVSVAVQPLLDSMIRNVDALLWMLNVQGNEGNYRQAIENCTLGLAFGRHLGLHMSDIRTLAIGMLLLDVGKYKVPANILNKPGTLSKEEFTEVKKHVEYGVEMLKKVGGFNEAVINMVQTHHERFNGSGYPYGLEDKQIPVFGRIAAIIDTYSSMSRKTPYRDAIAPHRILQELYKWRNKHYQGELVEQFLQCVGVYPTGSLVEMTTGEVGIVVAQNMRERLEPTICMLLDENKDPWQSNPIIDLSKNRIAANSVRRKILHALKSGSYGIASWQPSEKQRLLFVEDV